MFEIRQVSEMTSVPQPRMEDQEPLIQLPLGQLRHSQTQEGDPSQAPDLGSDGKPRRTRSKWTAEETHDLIKGCGIHGVGNWKKYVPRLWMFINDRILEDPTFKFNNRTSVDLKDR
jgi:hypothetical protein